MFVRVRDTAMLLRRARWVLEFSFRDLSPRRLPCCGSDKLSVSFQEVLFNLASLCCDQYVNPCRQTFLSGLYFPHSSRQHLIGVACCGLYISGEKGLPESLIPGKTTAFSCLIHCSSSLLQLCCWCFVASIRFDLSDMLLAQDYFYFCGRKHQSCVMV